MVATLALAAVLHGTVTIGPIAPVCRAGVRCDRPAAHVVLTFTHGRRTVRTKTGVRGRYTVRLAPGTYVVRASEGMRIAPARVIVRAGKHLRNFSIDTGIR